MPIQKITSGIIQDGAVAAADIVSVANTAISGLITASQIAAVSNTAITGLIQASQIGSANATLVTSGTLPGARLPAGSVLQVVYVPYPGNQTVATSTATSVLSGSITPTSSSNKILILGGLAMHRDNGNSASQYWAIFLYKTIVSSTLFTIADAALYQSTADGMRTYYGGGYLDTAGTTSAITYGITVTRQQASGSASFGHGGNMFLTLMEIAV